jgi:hypothetical protein
MACRVCSVNSNLTGRPVPSILQSGTDLLLPNCGAIDRIPARCNEVCTTPRWREPDSNRRYRVTQPRFRGQPISPLLDHPLTEKSARTRTDSMTTPDASAGPMVRIRFPPAGSLSQRRTPEAVGEKPALWRRSAGGWGREKGRAGCEPGLLRPFSLTSIDAVPPRESSD